MNYEYISEQSRVNSLLPILMQKNVWSLDTETTGLDPHKDKVVLLQIGSPQVQYILDTRKVQIEPLRPFFESEKIRKIGHNLKFDYKMIRGSFGIETEQLRDTYYAEKLLTMGVKFSGFSLAQVLEDRLEVKLSKEERSSFGDGFSYNQDFTREQLEYAARDVIYLQPLALKMSEAMKTAGLMDTWLLECEALPCFADMEFAGMCFDTKAWQKLVDDNRSASLQLEEELNKIAENVMQRDLFGEVNVNWGSPDQVVEVLSLMGVKIRRWDRDLKREIEEIITSSNDKTLKKVKDYKIVQLLKKYRGHAIRVNMFGDSYLNAVSKDTGRLHPEVAQIGTATGRPANYAKKNSVNFLNIPREKAYRHCFMGEENEVVETDDYSGCELRIWAELSKDPGLTEAFQKGVDVHCYVATKLFGKEVTKKDKERTPAKTLNFGGRI